MVDAFRTGLEIADKNDWSMVRFSLKKEIVRQYLMEEQESTTDQMESSVKQEDVCDIMNKINDALEGTGYQATAFDNTGIWLNVIIEG